MYQRSWRELHRHNGFVGKSEARRCSPIRRSQTGGRRQRVSRLGHTPAAECSLRYGADVWRQRPLRMPYGHSRPRHLSRIGAMARRGRNRWCTRMRSQTLQTPTESRRFVYLRQRVTGTVVSLVRAWSSGDSPSTEYRCGLDHH